MVPSHAGTCGSNKIRHTMSASVTHFEIYAEDLTGLAKFYRDLFDWKIEKAPGIDYFRIQTGTDGNPWHCRWNAAPTDRGTTQLGSLCTCRFHRPND